MKCERESMLVYAVTDRSWLNGNELCEQVKEALDGGATFIQLREKHLEHDVFLAEAFRIKELCKKYSVPFVINDNVEIAIECGADGVHVGQSDMQTGEVRRNIGEDKIIGVSAQTVEQAIAAERQGANYLGVGAVFSTSTKLDANTICLKTLKDICDAVSIPVIAIGGICEKNIMQLKGLGLDGVAVVSAIFGSENIRKATETLLALSSEMVKI